MEIIKRHIKVNFGGRRKTTDGVVIHSTGSAAATSQFRWFNNPKARASSHIHISVAGVIEEYVPSDLIAWCQGQGNARLLSIETQGDGKGPFSEAQLEAIAFVIAQWQMRYGFPLRLMQSSSKAEKGIGWHRLGVPPSRWVSGVGWLLKGNEKWSSAVGKICPGDARIAQMPEIVRRVTEISGQTPVGPVALPATPKPAPAKKPVATLRRGSTGQEVRKLQRGLNKVFPSYRYSVVVNYGKLLATDGIYGSATRAWVIEFQKRAGLVQDGICGPLTRAALAKYGVKI